MSGVQGAVHVEGIESRCVDPHADPRLHAARGLPMSGHRDAKVRMVPDFRAALGRSTLAANRPSHARANATERLSMQSTSRAYADVAVIAPEGRIDHAAAADFEHAVVPLLAPAGGAQAGLVLDFAGVPYISSAGLRVLMIAGKALRARKARIGLAAAQPVVAQILAISRFDSVLEIHATVRDALAAISPAAAAAYDASGGGTSS
jgi:anti-sigma B factor antagonist/stage II sporulation protein AA (anti-sigma F factor antagonist)